MIGKLQIPKNFTAIRIPVLALFEFPRTLDDHQCPGDYNPANDEERAAIGAFMLVTKIIADRWSPELMR